MGSRYPSRKQWSWHNEKSGSPYIPERHDVTLDSYNASAGGTVTLYSTPAGKRTKLVYLAIHRIDSGTGSWSVSVDGETLEASSNSTSPQVDLDHMFWTYEDGINIRSTLTLTRQNNQGANLSWAYVEEEATSSYYVDVETEEEE